MSIDQEAVGRLAPPTCRVSVGSYPGAAVFHLQGHLCASTAAELRRSLAGAVGEPAVILELTDLEVVDHTGLGVLLGVIGRVQQAGGRVAMAGAEPQRGIESALRAAGIDNLAWLADSAELARHWLENPQAAQYSGWPSPFFEFERPDGFDRLLAALGEPQATVIGIPNPSPSTRRGQPSRPPNAAP